MRTPSYMRSLVDRNVVMRRTPVPDCKTACIYADVYVCISGQKYRKCLMEDGILWYDGEFNTPRPLSGGLLRRR